MANENETPKTLTDLLHQLIGSYNNMLSIIQKINKVTSQTKMLSLNSSIEAARAGVAGRGFSVIATQIQNFSSQSQEANNAGLTTMKNLYHEISEIIGVRTADVAFDLIDKIDRNLFERSCDVTSWASLQEIRNFSEDPSEENQKVVTSLLGNLHSIYEVYHDIYLADENGTLIAAGVHQDQVGNDVSGTHWFQETKACNECYVSDMYYSNSIQDYTVSYSCPVKDANGHLIGILSARFNWNYVFDILKKAKISEEGEYYVINKDGIVIASKNKAHILKRNLTETYSAAHDVLRDIDYGYEIEEVHGELKGIIGYAHTKGYNSYPGKGWSVVVREPY